MMSLVYEPRLVMICQRAAEESAYFLFANQTNQVSLDLLNQAEFNAPYDVLLRHDGFSAILVYVQKLQNNPPIKHLSNHLESWQK